MGVGGAKGVDQGECVDSAPGSRVTSDCESASNLDPTLIVHQVVEADVELFISGAFALSFSRKSWTLVRHDNDFTALVWTFL
jgi:hypothetical protein